MPSPKAAFSALFLAVFAISTINVHAMHASTAQSDPFEACCVQTLRFYGHNTPFASLKEGQIIPKNLSLDELNTLVTQNPTRKNVGELQSKLKEWSEIHAAIVKKIEGFIADVSPTFGQTGFEMNTKGELSNFLSELQYFIRENKFDLYAQNITHIPRPLASSGPTSLLLFLQNAVARTHECGGENQINMKKVNFGELERPGQLIAINLFFMDPSLVHFIIGPFNEPNVVYVLSNMGSEAARSKLKQMLGHISKSRSSWNGTDLYAIHQFFQSLYYTNLRLNTENSKTENKEHKQNLKKFMGTLGQ